MDKFEEYEARVNEIESRYADCAFKSVNVKFLDGTTFNEHYSRIFRSKDIFTQQRNRYRTPFQLERDRILSSSLFQRLSGKTQLLTSTYEKRILMENRLTHTLKVMQIARSICRGLKLNEDLVEVIALGHDIGHPPFAHIGEKALEEWIKEKFTSKQKSLSESDIPILNNIRSEYRDKVKEYFTFGNDPKEKFFMHGRQGFRLLVLKRKVEKRDYLRFMRPVMYGIWRHSVKNFDTDNVFRFTKNMGEKNIKLSGKEDLTLEAQIVRYADDIAWITSDLEEGIYNQLIKKERVHTIINEIEDSTLAGRLSNIFSIVPPKVVELFTIFISDIITHNLERIQKSSNSEKIKIEFSSDIKEIFDKFNDPLIKEIHNKSFMARGNQVNKEQIKALCTWYFSNPRELFKEIKGMMHNPYFPIHLSYCEKFKKDNYSDYKLYENLIRRDIPYRISVITDFISALTDREVFLLSGTTPIY